MRNLYKDNLDLQVLPLHSSGKGFRRIRQNHVLLANIYLKQNGLNPTKWNENLLSKENPHRDDYIQALKKADNGDYSKLIELQSNLV